MSILEKRKALGMTQIDVAKAVGVSLQAYILWEKGVNSPKEENAIKLQEVLKEGVK